MSFSTGFKPLLDQLLMPPTGPLLLAVTGLLAWRRAPRAARLALVSGVVMLWLLSTPAVASALAHLVEWEVPPLTDTDLRALMTDPARAPQAIVVLGSGLRRGARDAPDGTVPSPRAMERLVAAGRAHRVTGLPVLVSGGLLPPHQVAEADVLARVLQESFGIEARWREGRSPDTHDNARESATLLRADGVSRVLLVTHALHMPRSLDVFLATGLQVTPLPLGWHATPVDHPGAWLPAPAAMDRSWFALHEMAGRLWYRLRGHTRAASA